MTRDLIMPTKYDMGKFDGQLRDTRPEAKTRQEALDYLSWRDDPEMSRAYHLAVVIFVNFEQCGALTACQMVCQLLRGIGKISPDALKNIG
jgi:hypothetical protein